MRSLSQPSNCILYFPKNKHVYKYNPALPDMTYVPLSPNLSRVPHVLRAPCLDVPANHVGRYGGDRGGKVGNKSLWLVGINKIIFSRIKISIL